MRKEIDKYGTIRYYNDKGESHREDGPSVECANGTKEWYKNGERHREDGPAIEYEEGSKAWFKNGKLHREDGPAVDYISGRKEYWYNDVMYSNIKSDEEWVRIIKLLVFQ